MVRSPNVLQHHKHWWSLQLIWAITLSFQLQHVANVPFLNMLPDVTHIRLLNDFLKRSLQFPQTMINLYCRYWARLVAIKGLLSSPYILLNSEFIAHNAARWSTYNRFTNKAISFVPSILVHKHDLQP